MRKLLIAAGVVVFVAVSVLVARWLSTEGDERAAVTELLRAQAAGDAEAMLARLDCPDARCVAVARANARRLRAPGELEIARFDSGTRYALTGETASTRVVWIAPGRLTTVQCVLVRREGDLLAGTSVSLLRLSAPIGREASCP